MNPVHVRIAMSPDVGGCNGCNDHIGSDGTHLHRVCQIRFAHGPEVRLCDRCHAWLRFEVKP